MTSVMYSPPAYPSETMPSAISHTRMKSRTKVSSQRRLCPGKWSQVLWWMWTFELWLPQPATTTRSTVMNQGGGHWIRQKQSHGTSGEWRDGREVRMRRQSQISVTDIDLACKKTRCRQPWMFPFHCNCNYLKFRDMQQRSEEQVSDSCLTPPPECIQCLTRNSYKSQTKCASLA